MILKPCQGVDGCRKQSDSALPGHWGIAEISPKGATGRS